MRHKFLASAAFLSFALAGSALAADAILSAAGAGVKVNAGAGPVAAPSGTALNKGDLVLVPAGQTAQVLYADGCALMIAGGSAYAVNPNTCAPKLSKQGTVEKGCLADGTTGSSSSGLDMSGKCNDKPNQNEANYGVVETLAASVITGIGSYIVTNEIIEAISIP